MKIKTNKRDIIWNYLSIFFSLASQIIWLPAILYFLTPEDLGIWYIFVSIGSIVTVLDFGFSPQISRSVAYSWSGAESLQKKGADRLYMDREPNYGLLAAVMRCCQVIYLIIAVAALVIMLIGGTCYLSQTIEDFFLMRQVAWFIYIMAIFFNIYIGWYQVILRGIGDIAACGRSIVLARAVMLILGIVLLAGGMGLLGLALTTLISSMMQREVANWYLRQRHEVTVDKLLLKARRKYSIRYVFTMIWPNAWRDGFVTSSTLLTSQATVLLCGSFLSLAETGVYSVSIQVINAFVNIARGLSSSYNTAIQSAFVTRSIADARQMIEKAVASYYVICIGSVVLFLSIGIPVLQFIRDSFLIDRMIFLILAIHMVLMDRHRLSAMFISATNRLPYTKAFVVSSFVAFFTAYVLIKWIGWGIYGLIIGPLVIQCLYNNWYWNAYLNRWLDTTELQLVWNGLRDGYKIFVEITRQKR